MSPQTKRSKVGRACQRCRRQKLKCDIQRPCTLCVRAGVDCHMGSSDSWRSFQPQRQAANPSYHSRKRRRIFEPHDESEVLLDLSTETTGDPGLEEQQWSSSTMSLVEGAFQFHNSSTPDTTRTTALPDGQRRRRSAVTETIHQSSNETKQFRSPALSLRLQDFRSTNAELVSLLPSREIATLLVDTYFDRVHWFMLIFQQDDFRQNWQQLYDSPREYITNNYSNPGFISLFLVVVAIAFQYTGTHRRQLLQTYHIDKISFKDEILSKIRDKILDIVSWGSLEAVQTCVLLGTYYLYHGNPGLAWPVCGCALRIAQAMNLHRRLSNREQISPRLHRQNETRKRCWWAIYEIETFCSMAYGYPHGIRDADCDVDLIDPLAKSMNGQSPASFDATHQCPASLLSYKYLMSRLSVLIKDILTDLYGIGSYRRATERDRSDSSSTLQNLVRQVKLLDARLRQWKAKIPAPLNIDNSEASVPKYRSTEEMDRDIGASGPDFEAHIYQLQAFSLELAYQNARILAHRPLLTYKIIPRAEGDLQSSGESCAPNSFHTSLQACRDAALKTSEMGTKSIFPLAVDTYAASFIGIHTFTAGVLLCILISIEPLSPQSYQSKMGLRRLLNMQVHLKSRSKSTLAVQGVEIMERLTKLVMEKELKEMLTSPGTGGPLLAPNPHNDLHEDPRDDIEPDSQILASSLPEVSLNEESIFDYIEDPAMSQALSDFDQVILGQDLEVPVEQFSMDSFAHNSGLMQEQAWIWAVDSLSQLDGGESEQHGP